MFLMKVPPTEIVTYSLGAPFGASILRSSIVLRIFSIICFESSVFDNSKRVDYYTTEYGVGYKGSY